MEESGLVSGKGGGRRKGAAVSRVGWGLDAGWRRQCRAASPSLGGWHCIGTGRVAGRHPGVGAGLSPSLPCQCNARALNTDRVIPSYPSN